MTPQDSLALAGSLVCGAANACFAADRTGAARGLDRDPLTGWLTTAPASDPPREHYVRLAIFLPGTSWEDCVGAAKKVHTALSMGVPVPEGVKAFFGYVSPPKQLKRLKSETDEALAAALLAGPIKRDETPAPGEIPESATPPVSPPSGPVSPPVSPLQSVQEEHGGVLWNVMVTAGGERVACQAATQPVPPDEGGPPKQVQKSLFD